MKRHRQQLVRITFLLFFLASIGKSSDEVFGLQFDEYPLNATFQNCWNLACSV